MSRAAKSGPPPDPVPKAPVRRPSRWPWLLLLVGLLATIALLVLPSVWAPATTTFSYTDFLSEVDKGRVAEVTVDDEGAVTGTLRSGDGSSAGCRSRWVPVTLSDAGFGPSLLCTVVGFRAGECRLGLVYLFKRGIVYPFAPVGDHRRDNELELRVRADLRDELAIEPDLERWFPIWDAPVP